MPNVDQYNPVTNIWTARASMPEGLYGIQPTAYDTSVYIVGGYLDDTTGLYATSSTLIYDSLADTWTNGTPIPVGDDGIATGAQAAYDGKIYFIGGDDGDGVSNTTTWEYTIISDTWTLRAPMPTERENNVAVTLNDKIYVAGGADGTDPNFTGLTTFEVYDPATDTWATLAPMQVAASRPASPPTARTSTSTAAQTDLGDDVLQPGQRRALRSGDRQPGPSSIPWRNRPPAWSPPTRPAASMPAPVSRRWTATGCASTPTSI